MLPDNLVHRAVVFPDPAIFAKQLLQPARYLLVPSPLILRLPELLLRVSDPAHLLNCSCCRVLLHRRARSLRYRSQFLHLPQRWPANLCPIRHLCGIRHAYRPCAEYLAKTNQVDGLKCELA